MKELLRNISTEAGKRIKSLEKNIPTQLEHKKIFTEICEEYRDTMDNKGKSQQFPDYPNKKFSTLFEEIFTKCLNYSDFTNEIDKFFLHNYLFDLRQEIELTLYTYLISKNEQKGSTQLIFTGYGKDQKFPSLVPVFVFGGFENKVNYHYRENEVIEISDKKPVAICPFAQKDVVNSILKGASNRWIKCETRSVKNKYEQLYSQIVYNKNYDSQTYRNVLNIVDGINYDMSLYFKISYNTMLNNNQKVWEKTLENYDLRAMAELAESLIDITGFQRILTFQQEGVGGSVDVAVISKNDGFTWISRKSWYHHKDVNGQYGRLGV